MVIPENMHTGKTIQLSSLSLGTHIYLYIYLYIHIYMYMYIKVCELEWEQGEVYEQVWKKGKENYCNHKNKQK